MRCIIDGDIFRYQFGNIQMRHPFLEDEFIPASTAFVESLIEGMIEEIREATGFDEYIIPLSGKGNFRHQIAKQQPYKGNRDHVKVERPFHYNFIGDYILANHPSIIIDDIEADDWCGIEQRKDLENTVVAFRDKDFYTFPGHHYRFSCGKAQPAVPMHWVSQEEANNFFFYQLLIGDNTDNIMGCGKKLWVKWGKTKIECYNGNIIEYPHWMKRRKGVGEKAAKKLLDGLTDAQQMYEVVRKEYEAVFGEECDEVMLEMARLLFIGQTPDNLFQWNWLGIDEISGE